MYHTIECYNLKQAARAKKIDSASIGVITTPRLMGVPINEYAIVGMTTLGSKPAHVIIENGTTVKNVDDIQFEIMRCIFNNETEWPHIIVVAKEESNQALKKIFPHGEVGIFTPTAKQSLSMYDIYNCVDGTFAGLISEQHLFS